MNFKHGMVLAGVALVVSACGGGSDDKKEPHEPYVNFQVEVDSDYDGRVNNIFIMGRNMPSEITLPWGQRDADDEYDSCDEDIYENAATVRVSAPSYCVTERSFVSVAFKFQYTNSTYENIDLEFEGLGYEVRIYEYDSGVVGDEVWNSSYAAQRVVDDFRGKFPDETVNNFDPLLTTSQVLDASDSYPSYGSFSGVTFAGDSNFQPGYASYDPDYLFKNPDESTEELCDWTLVYNPTSGKYTKVLCFGDNSLLPAPGSTDDVQFLARITVNFNDYVQQPQDIILTFTSPN